MNYIRDGRAPIPSNESISRVMSANRSKGTKPELLLRRALWSNKLRGYRLHYKKIPGRADVVFVSKQLAIFINGCYWHRCPHCNLPLPKSNTSFWKNKFQKNIERDKRKTKELKKMGWDVIIIWECQLKKNIEKQVLKILKIYNGK